MKPATKIITTEKCPSCDGKGVVQSSLLFTEEIESSIRFLSEEGTHKELKLVVHPMVEAYLNRGFFKSVSKSWKKKYKMKLAVEGSSNSAFLEYHIYDKIGEEVSL